MKTRWHRLALAVFSLGVLATLGGCFGSHGMPDPGAGDAAVPTPPTSPAPDAGTEPSDPPPSVPSTPPSPPVTGCRGSGPAGAVSVAFQSEGAVPCEFGEHDGVHIYDLGREGDGIVMLADLCPDADADCRCRIAVGGVGGDLLEEVAGITSAGLLRLDIAPNGIVVEQPCADDPCPDCACPADLLFAAMDAPPSAPPVHTDALSVAYADELCRTSDADCDYVMWGLEVAAWSPGFPGPIGTSTIIEQGQTIRDFGVSTPLSVSALRASGLQCGGDEEPTAAWVAWAMLPGV